MTLTENSNNKVCLCLLECNLSRIQEQINVAFGKDIMKYTFDQHLAIMNQFQGIINKINAIKAYDATSKKYYI